MDMDPDSGDRGETLLELVIALTVMAIAVVAIVGGAITTITTSDLHRKQTTAGAAVRDYAETLETFVGGTGYASCATTSGYRPAAVGFTGYDSSNYTASVAGVQYWIGGSWTASCTAATDSGLQQLRLQVASTDTRAVEQLVVVVRKPCASGSSC
jgi:type II secretory pathway pseudopilin PulG